MPNFKDVRLHVIQSALPKKTKMGGKEMATRKRGREENEDRKAIK
jgi:hypothetical protein